MPSPSLRHHLVPVRRRHALNHADTGSRGLQLPALLDMHVDVDGKTLERQRLDPRQFGELGEEPAARLSGADAVGVEESCQRIVIETLRAMTGADRKSALCSRSDLLHIWRKSGAGPEFASSI